MTVYTISEVLSPPSGVERSDKFYNSTIRHCGDIDLLRRFSNFARAPMEGTSCGLIWWLLHAAGLNSDSCAACHGIALSIHESSMMQLSGTGGTMRKIEYSVGSGKYRSNIYEKCLAIKSCEQQKSAAVRLIELSRSCSMVDVDRNELERCYIEQSEPLTAFAVALTIWVGNQGGKTGWLRPFLFGTFAARQPRHQHGYAARPGERLKTTVFRPGLDYNRGFQWLSVQKIKHYPNAPDCFKASLVGVYSQGHVMRILTSRDREKEQFLMLEEVEQSLYASRDWRLFDSWSNMAPGSGQYRSFSSNGFCTDLEINFDSPVNLQGVLLAGFCRRDGIWYSPIGKMIRIKRAEGNRNVLRMSRNPFSVPNVVNVTEDTLFG